MEKNALLEEWHKDFNLLTFYFFNTIFTDEVVKGFERNIKAVSFFTGLFTFGRGYLYKI